MSVNRRLPAWKAVPMLNRNSENLALSTASTQGMSWPKNASVVVNGCSRKNTDRMHKENLYGH
jgi:hypothetical protein